MKAKKNLKHKCDMNRLSQPPYQGKGYKTFSLLKCQQFKRKSHVIHLYLHSVVLYKDSA